MNEIKITSVKVSDKIIYPKMHLRGLGDVVSLVAQPIARVIDAVADTNLSTCGGCAKRQQSLNEIFPFASDETISLADKPDTE
jgi:hypothetical protein